MGIYIEEIDTNFRWRGAGEDTDIVKEWKWNSG